MTTQIEERLAEALRVLLVDHTQWLDEGVIAAGKGTRTDKARRLAINTLADFGDSRTHPAEGGEGREVARLLESLCAWLLHRFGSGTPEAKEAEFRLEKAHAFLRSAPPPQPVAPERGEAKAVAYETHELLTRGSIVMHVYKKDGRFRKVVADYQCESAECAHDLLEMLTPQQRDRRQDGGRGRVMKKTFVEFFSPGTFVSEHTEREIKSRDVDTAVEMARSIVERHGAKPYGFRFFDKVRGLVDLDSHVENRSGMYYLGGRIETLAEVAARNDPKEEILRSNMRCNKIDRVIVNNNSWRFTGEFNDGDTLLDVVL